MTRALAVLTAGTLLVLAFGPPLCATGPHQDRAPHTPHPRLSPAPLCLCARDCTVVVGGPSQPGWTQPPNWTFADGRRGCVELCACP